MADNTNNSFGGANHLCYGTLLLAKAAAEDITSLTLPENSHCTPITWEDIPGVNSIQIFSGSMPILANNTISYKGQPILAMIGPDYESSILAIKATKLETKKRETAGEEKGSTDCPEPEELVLSWSSQKNNEEENLEELKKIESTFFSKSTLIDTDTNITCIAWEKDGRLHVDIPCKWPDLVKETVAKVSGYQKKNVFVHTIECHSHYDEYAVFPAQLAAITAVAAIKMSTTVELRSPLVNRSPEVTIKRTTWCDSNALPIREEVQMTAELGAFLFAPEEYQRQAITGLIPNYQLNSFVAKVNVKKSQLMPSLVCGSMGYSVAIASSETQVDLIAEKFELSPLAWRNRNLSGKRRFTDYLPAIELSPLKEIYKEIVEKCNYRRKWPSYHIQDGNMSFLDFSRGIGMAVGVGISGISTTLAKATNYQARLNYTTKNNITLSFSLPAKSHSGKLLKELISNEMRLNEDSDVILFESDTSSLTSGPAILGRVTGMLPKQTLNSCRKLLRQAKTQEPPLTLTFDVDDKVNPCEFENKGSMAVIVEVYTDDITFEPVVRSVWANIVLGQIIDENNLKSRLKFVIIDALYNSGAVLSKDKEHPFTVNLNLESKNIDGICNMNQTIQGLVQAAFLNAMRQCSGVKKLAVPVYPRDLAENQE
ncbi:MAG: molybdopterin-dependent oxidoreductase [Sphaerochaetaceae bacterium]|nr:molybdopterin-dependent oxidoreductase [Sphaerochaetaceae bacterium]